MKLYEYGGKTLSAGAADPGRLDVCREVRGRRGLMASSPFIVSYFNPERREKGAE
ncbi:MAG: hypothetical protein JXL20_07505 [Deltaproteobacteria bacterium]|nr:hypothetical protein [Deltaproteobacteria bacterium]